MKKLFFIAFLMISSIGFSQEGVKTEGNTITVREIAPVWPGCEGSEAEKSDCFNKKLSAHVAENYQYVKDAEGNYVRGKSTVTFKVNKKGEVEIVSVKGSKPLLNKEAKRIIMLIPDMKPGSMGGEPSEAKYTIPFNF